MWKTFVLLIKIQIKEAEELIALFPFRSGVAECLEMVVGAPWLSVILRGFILYISLEMHEDLVTDIRSSFH